MNGYNDILHIMEIDKGYCVIEKIYKDYNRKLELCDRILECNFRY